MNAHRLMATLVATMFVALFAWPAARAAAPEEEARFVAAAQAAFTDHKPAGLSAITCWDRVPDKVKASLEEVFTNLATDKDLTLVAKLADFDPKTPGQDKTEGGVTYRANLTIVKQLELRAVAKDNGTLFVLTFGVGEKDGKLFLTALAPVK